MNKSRIKERLFNEKGSGLVLVLMVLLVLAALGSTLGMVTINSHRLANHTQDTNSAYYIAEAGANMAYEEFKKEVLRAYEKSSTKSDFFTANSGVKKAQASIDGEIYSEGVFQSTGGIQPTASIEVGDPVGTGDQRTFTIKSTGRIDGKTRVVDKDVEVNWISKNNNNNLPLLPEDTVMMIKNKITFTNGDINGDVFIDSENEDTIKLGWGTNFTHNRDYKYNIYTKYPELNVKEVFTSESSELMKHISVDPKYDDYTLNWQYYDNFEPDLPAEDTVFNEITNNLGNGKEIPIYKNSKKNIFTHDGHNKILLNGDSYFVVDEIHSGWGVTSIEGTGTLTIIVKNDMKISGGFNMDNNIDIEIIYLNADKELTIGGGDNLIWGNIIAPYSTVNVNGSAEVYGDIIAKEIKVTGQGKVYGNMYAKKAEFSGSGHLHGSIISEELLINNAGGTIKLGEMNSGGDTPGPSNTEDIISSKPATEK